MTDGHHTEQHDEWELTYESVSPSDPIRLLGLVRRAFAYPRFLSIGSIHNTVEIRVSRELYEQIKAITGPATSEGTDG